MVLLTALLNASLKNSVPSTAVPPTIGTSTFSAVVPGAKVKVPLVFAKS